MRQTVLITGTSQRCQATTAGKAGSHPVKTFLLMLLGLVSLTAAVAQTTYTTKADGNWSSAATWVGGVAPGTTINAGVVINIRHDVTFNSSNSLAISGTLSISGDTLRFPSGYAGNVTVQSAGLVNIANGGFLQDVTADKSTLEVNGGRFFAANARVSISKEFIAKAGARRSFRNSTVSVCSKYSADGSSTAPCIDTIQNATVQAAVGKSADVEVKNYTTLRVANAKLTVGDGNFKTDANASISVLSGATNNYGFNLLRTSGDLDVAGTWNARIDAYCIGKEVKGARASEIDFTRPEDCSTVPTSIPAPELAFSSPSLKSGTDKKEGAVYRFSNVATNVDAELKLKKFSRPDIIVNEIDYTASGWGKAFQPNFGLNGYVAPETDYYIEFEMSFYKAGTTTRTKIPRADFTAIDVDGDNHTLNEYAAFNSPANVSYSPFTMLTPVPAASLGDLLSCTVCKATSALAQCLSCRGTGTSGTKACSSCSGTGVLFGGCKHSFDGLVGSVLHGPKTEYSNIDTGVTAVMATFQYADVDHITFRYGARTGSRYTYSSTRLYSLWSKTFNLAPLNITLPVGYAAFSAVREKSDVLLNWQAGQVNEISHFVLQRSTDGQTFTDAAIVFAGASPAYAYKDKNVSAASGVVYYRIATVDKAREVHLTDTRMVRLAAADSPVAALAVYPNPATDAVSVMLPAKWQGKTVLLQLVGATGAVAKAQVLASAPQTATVTLAALPQGLYLVKAVCGQETFTRQVVKK